MAPPFSTLFPIQKDVRERITQAMKEKGYDDSQPINVWKQTNIVVNGHTRILSALDASVEVMVCFHDFKDEDEAMDYAIANQRNRRNLKQDEMFSLVSAVDKRKKHGAELGGRGNQHTGGKTTDVILPRSAEITAEVTGVNRGTVSKVRAINEHAERTGDTTDKDAVLAGEASINQAAQAVAAKKRKELDERRNRVKDYFKKHPGATFDAAMADLEMSRGTLQKHKEELCLTKKSKADKEKEQAKKVYQGVPIPDATMTPLNVRIADRFVSSDDENWLASLSVRQVVAHQSKFDTDALIVRHCKDRIQAIKEEIARVIGPRSLAGMTPLHRALHRVFDLASPESWIVCTKCKGTGFFDAHGGGIAGSCRPCDGLGYTIPNFGKGSSS